MKRKSLTIVVTFGIKALAIIWSALFIWYLLNNFFLLKSPMVIKLATVGILTIFLMWVIQGLRKTLVNQHNAAVAICSVLIILYIVESLHYWRFFYPGFPELGPPITFDLSTQQEALKKKIFLDPRSSHEVVGDLRLSGKSAYPAFLVADRKKWIEPGFLDGRKMIWPLSGISESVIVHCNESGSWAIYNSDKHGFNNPLGLWEEDVDVMLVGDSFVHGACVNEGEDFGSILRAEFVKTVNLGQRGNGPLLNWATIREYGKILKPKKVVWFYTEGNDLINLRAELSNEFIASYLDPKFSQDLINRQNEIDNVVDYVTQKHWGRLERLKHNEYEGIDHFKYIVSLRSLRKRLGLEALSKVDNRWKIERQIKKILDKDTKENTITEIYDEVTKVENYRYEEEKLFTLLALTREYLSSWGGKLYFVYLTTAQRYSNAKVNPPLDSRERIISHFNIENGYELIDLHKVFVNLTDPKSMFPFGGGHYNIDGYEKLGKYVLEHLKP